MPTLAQLLPSFFDEFGRLEPLLILAPTTRCGSTLLQRAINSAEGAIIYGENFVFLETAPLLLGGRLTDIEAKSRVAGANLDAFLAGEKDIDGSSLFPDYGAYRKLLLSLFFQIADFYRRESSKNGYVQWGLKHQVANLAGFNNFVQLVPHFRSVTIFRDAADVARSMQTRWPENLSTEAQCFEIGKRWRENLVYLFGLERSRNLVIRYEDLEARPADYIPKIESHFGLSLSEAAFQKKVNAQTFDPVTGKAGDTYRLPSDLAREKLSALVEGAQPLYGRLGYRIGA